MKRVPLLILLLAIFVALSPPAQATTYTLTDVNSTALVDPSSQSGMLNWTVDGTSILYQQWFWYRIGNSPEASIDTLTLTSAVQNTLEELDLLYSGAGFTISIEYDLTGGSMGSKISDIGEIIKIHNTSTAPMDFHFFQYSDFDLNQANRADFVRINPTLQIVRQFPNGNGPILSETVATPAPNHAEANYYANTLGKLNDGLPTTLNDVRSVGPGDVTWAFEWDKVISAGGTLLISKDKNLGPVPEPAAIGLFGGVLLLVASKLRKRVV